MKGLFLVFHGLSPHNGISKKIEYQCRALSHCGIQTLLSYTVIEENGQQKRMIGEQICADFKKGITATIKRNCRFKEVVKYVIIQKTDFLYIRHNYNANPFTVMFVRTIHRNGVKIAIEIPTYPYDKEFKNARIQEKLMLFIDKLFRHRMVKYADVIVTFTDLKEILGRPAINISNGIEFSSIKLKTAPTENRSSFNMIGVAQIHFWHGFDRIIKGMAAYFSKDYEKDIFFHVVGEGNPTDIGNLKNLVKQYRLEEKVIFYGPLDGKKLDDIFEKCDMGIASLGRHRCGIEKIKTLKNREYAARGIPFAYSETDEDFDKMPYILKIQADDSPVDIKKVYEFYESLLITPEEIRKTIENSLSWDIQMGKVIQHLFKKD